MTAGRFLQRMVDQGTMPLAEAVRPAWPAHAPAGHEAAEMTETARTDPASSAWAGPPPERAVGTTARAPDAPPGPAVSTAPGRPEPPGPRGVSPQPPAPAPQLAGSRPQESQPQESQPPEKEPGEHEPPEPGEREQEPGDRPGTEPRLDGPRPPDGAGARPAAPLRDAGIRSVTRLGGEVWLTRSSPPDAPGAAAVPGSGRPAAQRPGGQDEQWRDRWRDLGQRLLAEHPPAVPAGPAPPPAREAAREANRLSSPQSAVTVAQDAEPDLTQVFPPRAAAGAVAGAEPADRPPELVIEHLEVRLTPPAPSGVPPAPPAASRRVWDTAARHYLGRL